MQRRVLCHVMCAAVLLLITAVSNAELVAHYRFDEMNGNQAFDSVPTGLSPVGQIKSGVALGMPGVPKLGGTCFGFVGSPGENRVVLRNDGMIPSDVNPEREFTLTMWVKSFANPVNGNYFSTQAYWKLGQNGWMIKQQNDNFRVFFDTEAAGNQTSYAPDNCSWPYNEGKWVFLWLRYDGSSVQFGSLYDRYDRISDAEIAASQSWNNTSVGGNIILSPAEIYVGGTGNADSGNINAHIDDIRLYNNAISYNELAKVFNNQEYSVPEISAFDNVITAIPFGPAVLSAKITGNSAPITSVDFSLLVDDPMFPAEANAVLTDQTIDNQNPVAKLEVEAVGTYRVRLLVSDGITTTERITVVQVYEDGCQARINSFGGWNGNYFDIDNNCIVDIFDFAQFAMHWQESISIESQQSYLSFVSYAPKSIFDDRIEAESVSTNAVSNAPVTDTVGIRINDDADAIGGAKVLGYTNNGSYAEYVIDVPAAGEYDLHLFTATYPTNADNVLYFGTASNQALYGMVSGLPATGWDDYYYSYHSGALLFNSAGAKTLRITWGNSPRNLDWFTIVPHQ